MNFILVSIPWYYECILQAFFNVLMKFNNTSGQYRWPFPQTNIQYMDAAARCYNSWKRYCHNFVDEYSFWFELAAISWTVFLLQCIGEVLWRSSIAFKNMFACYVLHLRLGDFELSRSSSVSMSIFSYKEATNTLRYWASTLMNWSAAQGLSLCLVVWFMVLLLCYVRCEGGR